MMTGTIVNALAVLAGGTAGMLLTRLGRRFSLRQAVGGGTDAGGAGLGERLQTIVMQGAALCVVYLGVSGSLKGRNSLAAILSMVLGGIVGEALDLDGKLQALGGWIQRKASRLTADNGGGPSVADGFVTASLLFCVGAMAIVGSLQDGLTGDHSTLFAKALLDGTISIVLGASLGVGVLLSAGAILLYQGSITLAASLLEPLLTGDAGEAVIAEMTCVGSLLILALGTNMLGVTKIRVMNLVPGVFLPLLLCRFF